MKSGRHLDYRAIVFAPVAAFLVSLFLAALAGLFLGFFGSIFIDDPENTSILFDLVFLAAFVLPAYVFCGYLAARIAGTRTITHAAIAGAVFLAANIGMVFIGMAFSADPDEPLAWFGWTDAVCYLSVIPLAILGGKFAS